MLIHKNNIAVLSKAIREIEQGIATKASIDYFENVYNKVFEQTTWSTAQIKDDLFYRARKLTDARLFSNVSELKYPPLGSTKKLGRLNDVGDSIAYLSMHPLTSVAELDIDYYELFCMAEIKYMKKDIDFFLVGTKEAKYEGLTVDEIEFMGYINKLLTSANEEYYPATVAFARMVFKRRVEGTRVRLGIVYNSAQRHKSAQEELYNVAVLPKSFDECFRIRGVKCQLLSHAGGKIELHDVNNAKIKNGNVVWGKSYEEMIQDCTDKFKDDCFIINDEKGQSFLIKYPEGSGIIKMINGSDYLVGFRNGGVKSINCHPIQSIM